MQFVIFAQISTTFSRTFTGFLRECQNANFASLKKFKLKARSSTNFKSALTWSQQNFACFLSQCGQCLRLPQCRSEEEPGPRRQPHVGPVSSAIPFVKISTNFNVGQIHLCQKLAVFGCICLAQQNAESHRESQLKNRVRDLKTPSGRST